MENNINNTILSDMVFVLNGRIDELTSKIKQYQDVIEEKDERIEYLTELIDNLREHQNPE